MFVKVNCFSDYVGQDSEFYIKVDDDADDEYLNDVCEQYARDNYESYQEIEDDENLPYSWSYEKLDSLPEGEELREDLSS